MGNQQVQAAMQAVMQNDFKGSNAVTDAYNRSAFKSITDIEIVNKFFKNLEENDLQCSDSEDQLISNKMQKVFINNSRIAFEKALSDDEHNSVRARQLWQTGFTTWQHNLSQISNEPENPVMIIDRKSAHFELEFFTRSLMACANFSMRFRGATERKSVITKAEEDYEQGDKIFCFNASAFSIFFNLLEKLSPNLADHLDTVTQIVETLLAQIEGIPMNLGYDAKKQGLPNHLIFSRICHFLVRIIKNEKTPDQLRAKCVELLLRIGLVTGSAESLVEAAHFQSKYKIDISQYLTCFTTSEKFEPPVLNELTNTGAKWAMSEKNRIQNRCSFESGGDRQGPDTKGVCNGKFYFNFQANRGLTRAVRDPANGEWKDTLVNSSVSYEFLTFLVHNSQLYIRHKTTATAQCPFQQIDIQKMAVNPDAPAVGYADEESAKRWKKSAAADPKITSEFGVRWMGDVTQMCSDGKYVYMLVYHVDEVEISKRKALYIEKYSFENNQLAYIEERLLLTEDNKNFIGRPVKDQHTEGGYLNFGLMTCNGKQLVWCSRQAYHVFNLKTGKREKKHKPVGGDHIFMCDAASATFYCQDAAVYSWLEEFKIAGFDFNQVEEEDEKGDLPPIMFTLDEVKVRLKNRNVKKSQMPTRPCNIVAQIIGGKIKDVVLERDAKTYNENIQEAIKAAAESRGEDQAQEELPHEEYVYDWSRAILLAYVSKAAQESNAYARGLQLALSTDLLMEKFFKNSQGVQISQHMFAALREAINLILDEPYCMDSADVSEQLSLLNLLHIYIAHVGCLRPLNLNIQEILTDEELALQTDLKIRLEKELNLPKDKKEFPSPNEVLTERELFQLHIYHLKKQLCEEVASLLSKDTPTEQLEDLNVHLKQFNEQEKYPVIVPKLRSYHSAQLNKLFDEDGDFIGQLKEVMEVASEVHAARLQRRFDQIFNKNISEEQYEGFGSEEDEAMACFMATFLQELVITYTLQSKLILDNKLPENPVEEQKAKMPMYQKNLQRAQEKKEKLNELIFYTVIAVCKDLKTALRHLGDALLHITFEDWSQEEKQGIFTDLHKIFNGKYSILQQLTLFAYHTQLYDIPFTDLDEVLEAMDTITDGLKFYLNAAEIFNSQFEDLVAVHEPLFVQMKFFYRQFQLLHSKMAAYLVNDRKEIDFPKLEKLQILNRGVSEKFIPMLRQECKDQIEGSFKIVADDAMQAKTMRDYEESDATPVDKFVLRFLQKESDEWVDKVVSHDPKDLNESIISHRGDDNLEQNPLFDRLVKAAFIMIVKFQKKLSQLQAVVDLMGTPPKDIKDIDQKKVQALVEPLKKARQIKGWLQKRRREVVEQIKKEEIEKAMKQYKEDHPSEEKTIEKPTQEMMDKIEVRVAELTAQKMESLMENALEVLSYLRICETDGSKMVSDVTGINTMSLEEVDIFQIHPLLSAKRDQSQDSTQQQKAAQEDLSFVVDDIFELLQSECLIKDLQDFVEAKLVKGLRRLAGLHEFNKILLKSSDQEFYDALEQIVAALRANKVMPCHYLTAVKGCGARTEEKIRKLFHVTLTIISKRMLYEKDSQRLCQLFNALLWKYESYDMEILAREQTILILSGDFDGDEEQTELAMKDVFNPLRAAWGRESNYYSIECQDRNWKNEQKSSLSSRLSQCFDFLVSYIFKFTYQDQRVARNVDAKFTKIMTALLQQVNRVIFQKVKQFLKISELDEIIASEQRDQYVHFGGEKGEKADDPNVLMVDQREIIGRNVKAEDAIKKFADVRAQGQKIIDKYVKAVGKGDAMIVQEGDSLWTLYGDSGEEQDDQKMKDAIARGDWITTHIFENKLEEVALQVQAEMPASVVFEPVNKVIADDEEKLTAAKNATDKVTALLSYMKEREVAQDAAPAQKYVGFSRVTLTQLMKYLTFQISCAEASNQAARLPFATMPKDSLTDLILLSLEACPSVQCLCQKIFQSLLRISVPQQMLETKFQDALARGNKRMKALMDLPEPSLRFSGLEFWQLLFNQIQMTKRAQFSPFSQVEVGKTVVVEEIARTFMVHQTLTNNSEKAEDKRMHQVINTALLKVAEMTEEAVSSVFSIIPEANIPVIAMGQMCSQNKDQFVVLGFSKNDSTEFTMVPSANCNIQGLLLDSASGRQAQHTYELRNVKPISNTCDETLSREQRQNLERERLKTSPFMDYEILKIFLDMLQQKNTHLRSNPTKRSAYSYLEIYIQNGLMCLLNNFTHDFLTIVKSYNLLENLVQYLTQAANEQKVQPEDFLVGINLMTFQAAEVHMAATYLPLCSGFYKSFEIIFDETNQEKCYIIRKTAEVHETEFIRIDISAIHGEEIKKRKCNNADQKHDLTSYYSKVGNSRVNTCAKCSVEFNSANKHAQLRTGFMRCLECQQDTDLCNQCSPKLQHNNESSLKISPPGSYLNRLARQEVVMIPAAELATVSSNLRLLAVLRMSNIVVTDLDEKYPLQDFLLALNDKISEDVKWKECANIRIVTTKKEQYAKYIRWLNGEPHEAIQTHLKQTKNIMTTLYRGVTFVQNKINSEECAKFCHKFMEFFKSAKLVDDLKRLSIQTLMEFFEEVITEEFGEDDRQRQTLIEEVTKQLKELKDDSGLNQADVASVQLATQKTVRANAQAINFMQKFSEGSNKLVEENGKEYFIGQSNQSDRDFSSRFDDLAFKWNESDPKTVLQEQSHQFLEIYSMLMARKIWLFLMSQLKTAAKDIGQALNMSNVHKKVCNLVHDSHMAASHERIFFGYEVNEQETQQMISDVLEYFEKKHEPTDPNEKAQYEVDEFEKKKFRIIFYQDFLLRADVTIEAVRKENYVDLQSYNLRDLRKVSKLPNVLDPTNILFLSRQLYDKPGFLKGTQRTQMAKVMFDLHLGFAILFKQDEDTLVSQKLIQGCAWALDEMQRNIRYLVEDEEIMLDLLTSPMLKSIFKFMSDSEMNTPKAKLMNEVLLKLNQIFVEAKKITDNLTTQTVITPDEMLKNKIKGYQALLDGKEFTSYIVQWKLVELLYSSQAYQVAHVGQSFSTQEKMFRSHFFKSDVAKEDIVIQVDKITTDYMIGIKNLSNKTALRVDKEILKRGGKNWFNISKGQQYEVEFPITPNDVWQSGSIIFRREEEKNQRYEDYKTIENVTVDAVQLISKQNHLMIVGSEGQIMTYGHKVCSSEFNQLRIIEKPENCTDYAKISVSKCGRFILTKAGKLFFNGLNKRNTIGKTSDDCSKSFIEITTNYPIPAGDKIIDISGGKYHCILCTEQGRVFASGQHFFCSVDDKIRINAAGDNPEQLAFEIKAKALGESEGEIPANYQVTKVYASDRYFNVWATATDKTDPSKQMTFCLGDDYDMCGRGEGSGSRIWKKMKLPENVYLVDIATEGMYAVGIDNEGYVWEWGSHKQSNKGDEKLWDKPCGGDNGNSTPYRIIWFKAHNKEVLRIRCGVSFSLFECRDTESKEIEIYALGGFSDEIGKEKKQIYGDNFWLIQKFSNSKSKIVDFNGTKSATFFIIKNEIEVIPSIVENEPNNHGLTHFYFDEVSKEWEIVKQEDFEDKEKGTSRKNKMPDLLFATRHPIKNWDAVKKSKVLPNLTELLKNNNKKSIVSQPGKVRSDRLIDPYTKKPVDSKSWLYVAKTIVNGKPVTIPTTQDKALKGGQQFDLDPVVFYVMKKTGFPVDLLPTIDPKKLFGQAPAEVTNDMIGFSIVNQVYSSEDVMRMQIKEESIHNKLEEVRTFKIEEDYELLRAIDEYRRTKLDNCKIQNIKESMFSFETLPLASASLLKQKNSDVVQKRLAFLVKFSTAVANLLQSTHFEESERDSSIQQMIVSNKEILLQTLKIDFIRDQLIYLGHDIHNHSWTPIQYDRKLAIQFKKLAKKHDSDFITNSTFGQCFQALRRKDAQFTMLANQNDQCFEFRMAEVVENDNDFDNNWLGFVKELENDLCSDRLPLLIRTRNGQEKMGIKRDCWILNPRVNKPEELNCYQLIGALIGRQLFRPNNDENGLRVPFAPTFYKLLLDEQVTLDDFALENCTLADRLKFLDDEIVSGEETWHWTDSTGAKKAISGHSINDTVEDSNEEREEFVKKLLDEYRKETEVQMKSVRIGFQHILNSINQQQPQLFMTSMLNWHDLMRMVERVHLKTYDIQHMKDEATGLVQYINCDPKNEEDKKVLTAFWTVLESLNYEDKKAFFKFNFGMSRVGPRNKYLWGEKWLIKLDGETMTAENIPIAVPEDYMLILPKSYEGVDGATQEETLKKKLLQAIALGPSLESN